MPARRIALIVSPLLTFVEWLFSALIPFVDLLFGLLAAWWLFLMLTHSEIFDQGNLQGMQWLPDQAWIVFLVITGALHFVGLARLTGLKTRVFSNLLTSWYWLLVAISLSRLGWSTGAGAYGLFGTLALCAAIYISGRHRQVA